MGRPREGADGSELREGSPGQGQGQCWRWGRPLADSLWSLVRQAQGPFPRGKEVRPEGMWELPAEQGRVGSQAWGAGLLGLSGGLEGGGQTRLRGQRAAPGWGLPQGEKLVLRRRDSGRWGPTSPFKANRAPG